MRSSCPAVFLVLLAACGAVPEEGDKITYTLTVSPSTMGAIVSSPAGISCGADCSEAFEEGTAVTLKGMASGGSILVGWSDAACSGPGDCTVLVTGDLTVQAMFALASPVAVTLAGTGTGTVTSSGGGINCPGDCSEAYAPGQMITLTAAAGVAAGFAGWSGGGCAGTGQCAITTNTAVSVTAVFARALTCSTVATAASCSNGTLAEINLGMITGPACHDQCQIAMATAGMTAGCWVVAINGNCYCRDGVLATGGNQPGGACN